MKSIRTLFLFVSLLTPIFMYGQTTSDFELVWSEEFNDTAKTVNAANWNFDVGGTGWGNQELQYYTNRTDNARVENGCLILEAKKEVYTSYNLTCNYTSGRINTKAKASSLYGKIEARMSLPSGAGTWPAFWMMPEVNTYGNWPSSGEIDIMEHIGSDPTMISMAVHTKDNNGSKGNNWYKRVYPGNVENQFHTYGIEWEQDAIRFYIDSVKQTTLWRNLSGTYTTWPFDKSFYVILNLAIGGKMGGAVNDAIFDSPVKMAVDFVRIYKSKTAAINSTKANSVKVYPTAFRDILTVATDETASVIITDLAGRKSLSTNVSGLQNIDTSLLTSGVYFISVKQKNNTSTFKVFKK